MSIQPDSSLNSRLTRVVDQLLRFRWLIASFYLVAFALLEMADQWVQTGTLTLTPFRLVKFLLFAILVPVAFLVLIQSLVRLNVTRQKQVVAESNLENSLADLLSSAADAGSFSIRLKNFFQANFTPLQVSVILSALPQGSEEEREQDPLLELLSTPDCSSQSFLIHEQQPENLHHFFLLPAAPASSGFHRYCLPIGTSSSPLGMVFLDLPHDSSYSSAQIRFFKKLAKIISVYYSNLQLAAQLKSQKVLHETELQHISQNLHDSLGQSIGFIRLKMEQIRHDFPDRRYPGISQDLDRVQSVTEEAYEQVRGLLAELHPNSYVDLRTTLNAQTATLAERAGFHYSLKETGQPHPLPPLVKRQLFFILREALINVEKHARANQVDVLIAWEESNCFLSIQDDGVGFTPTETPLPDHYGLVIMQERAQDISASFHLESSPGNGTRIALVVPLSPNLL